MYIKNYECVIMQMTMVADFSLKMQRKRLAAGLRLNLLRELTALPQIPYMDIRATARVKTRGGKRQEEGRVTGEARDKRKEGRKGKI